jgi:hypothetical protein
VFEVERDACPGIERAEDQLEHPFVARALQRDARRAEPVAQQAHARAELGDDARAVPRQFGGEGEARRRLLRPAHELLLGG